MFNVRQFEARTLSWWADQRATIDVEPPYQRRGGIWSDRDKAFLIDSILNQYDIPKLYLADFTFVPSPLNVSSRNYAVIDGKQRLEAIFDFIDGRIVLAPDFSYVEAPELSLGGLGYRDLRANYPAIASRFDNYNLTVMAVVTDEEGRINELFVRLNRNKTLTGPEIRNAMVGEIPRLTRSIAEHPFFECVRFSTQRGQDLDAAAKFLIVEFRGRLVDTKRRSLDRFVEEGVNADASATEFGRAADRVQRTLGRMAEIFLPRDPLLSAQGSLVPYYWLVRATPLNQQGSLRPFLVSFEALRALNRQVAKNPDLVANADANLLRYDGLARSINDAGSIEGRYEILAAAFKKFLVLERGPAS